MAILDNTSLTYMNKRNKGNPVLNQYFATSGNQLTPEALQGMVQGELDARYANQQQQKELQLRREALEYQKSADQRNYESQQDAIKSARNMGIVSNLVGAGTALAGNWDKIKDTTVGRGLSSIGGALETGIGAIGDTVKSGYNSLMGNDVANGQPLVDKLPSTNLMNNYPGYMPPAGTSLFNNYPGYKAPDTNQFSFAPTLGSTAIAAGLTPTKTGNDGAPITTTPTALVQKAVAPAGVKKAAKAPAAINTNVVAAPAAPTAASVKSPYKTVAEAEFAERNQDMYARLAAEKARQVANTQALNKTVGGAWDATMGKNGIGGQLSKWYDATGQIQNQQNAQFLAEVNQARQAGKVPDYAALRVKYPKSGTGAYGFVRRF